MVKITYICYLTVSVVRSPGITGLGCLFRVFQAYSQGANWAACFSRDRILCNEIKSREWRLHHLCHILLARSKSQIQPKHKGRKLYKGHILGCISHTLVGVLTFSLAYLKNLFFCPWCSAVLLWWLDMNLV